MNTKQAKNLSLIFRQMCGVVKRSIDEIAELADSALLVIADETPNSKALPSGKDEKRLLNKTELSERLNVSVRSIDNLIADGFKPTKIGRRVLFDYEKVLLWIDGREIKSRRKSKLRVVK